MKMTNISNILVTGGAGFIGSAFVREALKKGYNVFVLDALTYAGNLGNLDGVLAPGRCEFIHGGIEDQALVASLLRKNHIDAVVHFAAESHVDNSINGPLAFMQTNIMGTFHLLESFRGYIGEMSAETRQQKRFVHVSTDEVFGQLGKTGYFVEESPYQPNSPYSASKAASDHIARAWFHTYGVPVVTTNCSNNYGPRQFPEKLIPRMITCSLRGEKLPVYGKGENIRDWIHVEDHSRGILLALEKGRLGESYCFGGRSERTNLDVVKNICTTLDQVSPQTNKSSYSELISFVEDRKGHDFRYAIDDSKARKELGFVSQYESFEIGLKNTIQWYLDNKKWLSDLENK